ncbi:hypothetical protein GUI12_03510 [Anaplasmataceae bacterium AB001_6]|nr:hypothetical protein GUI12_03510 [Anaplasmataceae bacterium AB001_6]
MLFFFYTVGRFIHRFILLQLIIVFNLFLCSESLSKSAEFFEDNQFLIQDIEIAVSKNNVILAKKEAIREAKRQALEVLLKKITSSDYSKLSLALNNISDNKIDLLINYYNIKEEKITSNSYRAKMNFQFDAIAVEKTISHLLKEYLPSRQILLIPLLQKGKTMQFWDNDWYNSWNNLKKSNIIIPMEDMFSINNIRWDYSNDTLFNRFLLKRYYGADDIIIARALIKKGKRDSNIHVGIVTDAGKNLYSLEYFFNNKTQKIDKVFDNIVQNINNKIFKGINTIEIKYYPKSNHPYNIIIFDKEDRDYILNKLSKYPYTVRYISSDALVISILWEDKKKDFISYVESNNITINNALSPSTFILKRSHKF